MYKNCREELLAVLTEFVKEKGVNEFTRPEALAAMRRAGTKYKPGSISAQSVIGVVRTYHGIINRCTMIMRNWEMAFTE